MSLKTRRLTVRLPEDLLARLHYRANVEGLPLSAILRHDLSRANARWRPPAASTSGLSLTWPEDTPVTPSPTTTEGEPYEP